MKTHLLQIATVEEHNIVYKNVYGNDIESYINNLISFVESDMVIDLANLLLNDNELYLTAESIMKSDIIKDDTIKYLNREWFNEWLIETIKINYDDDVVTVDLPVNGDTLAFIMIIFNRFDNKIYYLGLISRNIYTEIDNELVQYENGFLIHHTIILNNNFIILLLSLITILIALILDLLTDARIIQFVGSDSIEELFRIIGSALWFVYYLFYVSKNTRVYGT